MSNPNKPSETAATDQNEKTGRTVLYDFTQQGKGNWRVQDDVVMGGRSDSQLKIADENRACFSGRVSLENNGGFCSITQTVVESPYIVTNKTAFVLRLKGDGKDYSFRVRTSNGRHSYGLTFPTQTGGNWETISIPFSVMEAKYRGRTVEVPNYVGEKVVGMQILIGNKKEENFELWLEAIEVI